MKRIVKDPDLGICVEVNCKAKQERLHFCESHYDEFKFGTIRKDGTHPIDRERKLAHYAVHVERIKK